MRYAILVVAVGIMAVAGIDGWLGAATDEPNPPTIQLAQISGDPDPPRRHFRVRDPGDLTAIEAEDIYGELRGDMAKVYAMSGDALAAAYQKWPRYNSAPYLSKTHGQRYASGDWRYTMIMPDGAIFGTTRGENAERVEYCIGYHLARERFDRIYFPPKDYRNTP